MGSRFVERGGLWLAGQLPLMAAAYGVPVWLGSMASGSQRWMGLALLVAGLALGGWSRHALGKSFTPFPRPVAQGSQAMHGPYRWVRHPIYSGIVLSSAGWALAWQSWAGAALTGVLLVFFDLKARREEAWLADAYPGYADYARRTRKLVPFIY